MSKFKIAKKTLAVFLAALMVLSSWGGVTPFSLKAKAVEAGQYEVTINYQITDTCGEQSQEYTGESSFDKESGNKSRTGFSLYYKTENGTGDEYEVWWDLGYKATDKDVVTPCGQSEGSKATVSPATTNVQKKASGTAKAVLPGFPTKLFVAINNGAFTDTLIYTINSIVVSNGTEQTTIWQGTIYMESKRNQYYGTLYADTHKWDNNSDSYAKYTAESGNENWYSPKASTIVWDTEPEDIEISKEDGTTVSANANFHVVDQYGVTLSSEALKSLNSEMSATVTATNYPTKNYSGSTYTTLGTDSSEPLYYATSDTASSYNVEVSAKSDLKSDELGLNERLVTVTAKAGSLTDTKQFKIYDPKYIVTFNKGRDTDGNDAGSAAQMAPSNASVYYGETLKSQSELNGGDPIYPVSGDWAGHTWLGMYDSNSSDANEMNIDEPVKGNKTYYARWNANTYTVVFLDRDGSFIDAKYCGYGEKVSTADADAKLSSFLKANEDEHWALKADGRWKTADGDAFDSATAVNSNLIVVAQYDLVKHSFGEKKTLDATCQHGNGSVQVCGDCGYEREEYTDNNTVAHAASDVMTVVEEPTCTAKGKGVYYCKYCGIEVVKEKEIPALGHSYTINVIKEASCTEDGSQTLTCTRESCGYSTTEVIPKLQHEMVAGTEMPATCTSSAYTPYSCENCTYSYNVYDENQPAIGHAWGDWTVTRAATNTEKGEMTRQCSKCDELQTVEIPAGGHAFGNVPTEETPATCTVKGSQTFTCTAHDNCGVSITVETATIAHSYKTTKTDAKCETAGSVVSECTVCHDKITTEIPATGHNWNEGTVTVPATCTDTGTLVQTCSSCQGTREITIPATGHKYVTIPATCTEDGKKVCACGDVAVGEKAKGEHTYTKEEVVLQPTCVSQGIKTKTCDCGAVQIEFINKTDHTYGELQTDTYPTCTAEGQKSKHCTVCGQIDQASIVKTGSLGHTYYTATEPTKFTHSNPNNPCLDTVTKTYKCDRCDCASVEVVAAKGHTFVEDTTESKEATCGEAGYRVMKCTCGESYKEFTSQPTGKHNWTYTATNTNNKLTVKVTCSTCNATYTTEAIDVAEGHTYDKVEVTKYPTCIANGEIKISCSSDHNGNGCTAPSYTAALPSDPEKGIHKTFQTFKEDATCTKEGKVIVKCSDCVKEIATETIPATGHTFDVNDPTYTTYTKGNCKTAGTVTLKCKNCEHSETYELSKDTSAHVYGDAVNHDATCTTPAYKTYTCTLCNHSYNEYDGTSKANGHDWKATISQTGSLVTVTLKCDTCGEDGKTFSKSDIFAGHNYDKFEIVQATCSQEGKVVISCSDEGCEAKLEFPLEKNTSVHTNLVTKVVDATCTVDGRAYTWCDDCQTQVGQSETISKTGHDFYTNLDSTAANPAPTCTEEGKKTVNCSHCDETQEVTVPKLGHDYAKAEGEGKKATCTDYGWDVYKCTHEGCKATYNALVEATKHNVPQYTTVEATCTAGGYSEGLCTKCSQTVRFDVTSPKGHDFENEGEVINEGNCVEQKIIKHPCNNGCGEFTYEYIGEIGSHSWQFVERHEATCGERSYDLYKCTKCEEEEKRNFGELLEHDWDFWTITKHPTETEPGSQERECLRCKAKEVQEITSGDFYLVTFYNYDGTRLIRPAYYSCNSAARVPSKTPVRVGDAGYTYTFSGYSYSKADLDCVTKQMAVMAQYDAHERIYDITYLTEGGAEIQTVNGVPYSKLGTSYTGATPTKAEDQSYTYTFEGWTVSCNTETLKATATPSFTAKLKPNANTGNSEGILTRFVEWIKNLFKQIFGKLFG